MLRARLVLLAGLGLGAGLACNSDDPQGGASQSSTGPGATTGDATTGPPPTTGDATTGADTSSSGAPTTGPGESGDETTEAPPQQTCRDVLTCVGMCALTLDPACFQMCTEGLSPEEGMKAIALGGCVVQNCFAEGICTPETLQDPGCLACIGLGILTQNPDGCEEQAEACQ